MINYSEPRLLPPETIWLEAEDYQTATAISNRITEARQRWQTYLELLALSALKTWLTERLPNQKITQKNNNQNHYLQVGNFTVSAIALENILDEIVYLPQSQLRHPTHFYAAIEIVEEEEEAIFRGFLRRDRLDTYLAQTSLQSDRGYYPLPLSWFDPEPNHLVAYCQHLAADAIVLPATSTPSSSSEATASRTKLAQWIENTAVSGWSTIENLINPELTLAFNTRSLDREYARGKLINLGLQMNQVTMTLLLTVQEEEDKLKTKIQLYPTSAQQYLPPQVQLNLLSKAGKTLQSVRARERDNFIQLKPFKGKLGTRFSLEIALEDAKIREDFEL